MCIYLQKVTLILGQYPRAVNTRKETHVAVNVVQLRSIKNHVVNQHHTVTF